MAIDKMVDSAKLDREMLATANAIREKGKTEAEIPWEDEIGFRQAVLAIQSGGEKPQLIVTAPVGSTITAVNGDDTVTGAVGTEGSVTLDLPAFGTWAVTATLDGQEASTSVYIEQEYPVSLSYLTTFTVNGGHGETVTVYHDGENIGSVTLDSSGTGTLVLSGCAGKTLVFSGGLSGYKKTVIAGVEGEKTVDVYPDGAMYWYGRKFEEKTGGFTKQVSVGTGVRFNSSNIEFYATKVNGRDAAVYTGNKMNLQGYTKLCANVTASAHSGAFADVNLGLTTIDSTYSPSFVAVRTATSAGTYLLELDIPSTITGPHYVCLSADTSLGFVYNVWAE